MTFEKDSNFAEDSKTYRVQGFSCTNCAATFEENVKALPGVHHAKVNFGAGKVSVIGHTTIEELEQAGAFENLKIRSDEEQLIQSEPFWKQRSNRKVYISALLIVISWLLSKQLGEMHIIPLVGYLVAIFIGGYSLFLNGLKNLSVLKFDMHTLMTIAIIGAILIGQWLEGATVVILFAISEVLERYSMDKARQSIASLMKVTPKEALIRRGTTELVVAVENIQIGDLLLVKPAQKFAMDGKVVSGISTVNQAAITGESMPVVKEKGDEVFAGTLNEDGFLEVQVTRKVEDSTIAKIIHLVEEAQAERAPTQAFIDRFAKYYTPAIIILALFVAIIPSILTGEWHKWVYQGLAVLVVGCPCALVVSTPVAVVTAIGNAAKNGVLIKGGIHLEEVGHIKAVAFDKTGTLTKGMPSVTDVISFNGNEAELMTITAAIEKSSQHPIASAIVAYANEQSLTYNKLNVEDFQSLTGKGLRARVNEQFYFVGNPSFFSEVLERPIEQEIEKKIVLLQEQGKTVLLVGVAQEILLLIAVIDEIRPSSNLVIQQLRKLAIDTIMLTGDHEKTAAKVGKQLSINTIKADLLPQNKVEAIKELTLAHQHIAMVGDGVNDAPALAAASVGVAMGGAGTDTALETADIVLMSDDLKKLPYTIQLSRKALAIIKQNIAFALGLKLVALALVVPGWLTLWIAIFADMGATLIVIINSLRLLAIKKMS